MASHASQLVAVMQIRSTNYCFHPLWPSPPLPCRYGEDAAEVSVHSMNAAGQGADAWFAARKLGVKTVAKSAAKKTARGVIHKWAGTDGRPGSSSSASSLAGGSKEGVRAGSSSSGSLARSKPGSSGSLGGGGVLRTYRAGL